MRPGGFGRGRRILDDWLLFLRGLIRHLLNFLRSPVISKKRGGGGEGTYIVSLSVEKRRGGGEERSAYSLRLGLLSMMRRCARPYVTQVNNTGREREERGERERKSRPRLRSFRFEIEGRWREREREFDFEFGMVNSNQNGSFSICGMKIFYWRLLYIVLFVLYIVLLYIIFGISFIWKLLM